MKIPNYIEKLLDRRAKLAAKLNNVDVEITKFIIKHEIEVEDYDYATGVEIYVNPYSSAKRVKEAILAKKK